jgi:diacylglycerol kinase
MYAEGTHDADHEIDQSTAASRQQPEHTEFSPSTTLFEDQSRLQNCIKDLSHGRTESLVNIKFHSLFNEIREDDNEQLLEEVEEQQIQDEIYSVIKKSDLEYLEHQTDDNKCQGNLFTKKKHGKFRKTFNWESLRTLLKRTKKYARKHRQPPNEVSTLNKDDDLEETKEVQETDNAPTSHKVFINVERKHSIFRRQPSNYIRSTKYTWWNFIPKNLFEQFLRISNLYFLITMIVSLIPGVSPIFPITSIIPLAWILLLTAIKDAIEDLVSKFSFKFTIIRHVIEAITKQIMYQYQS